MTGSSTRCYPAVEHPVHLERMPNDIKDRNVFILGAGFSCAAGAPLVNNFLDLARELYDDPTSDLDDGEREIFGRVFEFRQAMSRAREKMTIDLDNIEN